MPRKKTYRQELNERKQQLENQIANAEKELSNRSMDKSWLEGHRKINHLRVRLSAVNSRIANLRKKHGGIIETSINFNYYKSGLL